MYQAMTRGVRKVDPMGKCGLVEYLRTMPHGQVLGGSSDHELIYLSLVLHILIDFAEIPNHATRLRLQKHFVPRLIVSDCERKDDVLSHANKVSGRRAIS